MSLFPLLTPRLAGASDAVQEEGFGLGGFLLSDKTLGSPWSRSGDY